jgi:hypothetical protein
VTEEKNQPDTRAQTQEILKAISAEIPFMIKNILNLVFSEDSGRTLGKAAAAYYKELRNGGLPEEAAVRLTENYMKAFTSLADFALPEKLRSMKNEKTAAPQPAEAKPKPKPKT